MIYTEAEYEQLKENTAKIEEYLHTLMPNIRETIRVEFGPMTTRRGSYGMAVREREFELYVGSRSLFGASGGLRYDFEYDPRKPESSGLIDLYRNRGFGVSYMAALCSEWRMIKSHIMYEYGNQQQIAQRINNFKL